MNSDLISQISNYLYNCDYYYLSKDIYNRIKEEESNNYWKEKYKNYLKSINADELLLNGHFNWKHEYIRATKFDKWNFLKEQFEENKKNTRFHLILPFSKVPKELKNFKNLFSLTLLRRNLTQIPNAIFYLEHLKELDLSYNSICDIPYNIVKLKNLEKLQLEHNKITEISSGICQLVSLIKLMMHYNQIKNIPINITQLQNLKWLILNENFINMLPKELANIPNLRILCIANNNIETIPQEIIDLKLIGKLYLLF